MARTSVERMYNIIFDISSKLEGTLEDAQQLVSISHEYGGMISKIIEEQILQYLVPAIKDFIENADKPGSLKGLVNFLDTVPLKQTRLTPGEYAVESLEQESSADTVEEALPEASMPAQDDSIEPEAESDVAESVESVEDLPQNVSFSNPLPVEEEEIVEEDIPVENPLEEGFNESVKRARESKESEEDESLIRWTVVRTHSVGSSYGNELKDTVVGEFKSEEEAFEMMERLNNLVTPEERDLLGTGYAVEKITVISSDYDAEHIEEHAKVFRQLASNRLQEESKVYYDLLDGTYKPWSGAVDTWDRIVNENKLEALNNLILDMYPEGISDTQLNDLLWFDWEWLYSALGMEAVEPTEEN